MAHLPARAVPLHARPLEPAAHLVPRTRHRGPAVAREAPSRCDLLGQRCRDRRVPAAPVGDRRQRHGAEARQSADKVYYATTSRELASGVTRLLSRLGIIAAHTTVRRPATGPAITSPSRTAPACGCSAVRSVSTAAAERRPQAPRRDGQGRAVNTNVDTLPRRKPGSSSSRSGIAPDSPSGSSRRRSASTTAVPRSTRAGCRGSGCCAAPTPSAPTLCARSPAATCSGIASSQWSRWALSPSTTPPSKAPTTSSPTGSSRTTRWSRMRTVVTAAPRGRVRAGVAAGRRGGPHPGQAPQRADRHGHGRLPGPLLALRGHGRLAAGLQ